MLKCYGYISKELFILCLPLFKDALYFSFALKVLKSKYYLLVSDSYLELISYLKLNNIKNIYYLVGLSKGGKDVINLLYLYNLNAKYILIDGMPLFRFPKIIVNIYYFIYYLLGNNKKEVINYTYCYNKKFINRLKRVIREHRIVFIFGEYDKSKIGLRSFKRLGINYYVFKGFRHLKFFNIYVNYL